MSPTWVWTWPYLVFLQRALERVTSGACRRLMVFMPPRHGKSEQTTIRYPVWRLARDPEVRVCVGCYNQSFAERFGRRSRLLARRQGLVGRERTAAKEWETHAGGVYRSCGVGSVPMGEGFNLIVIDDPIKSREEAESLAYRERAWDWYSDLYTRQEPGCSIVLIQTRWHEDDLAGRLLAAAADGGEQWDVVSLPAFAEENDPVGRAVGDVLCPDRFDRDELERRRSVLGNYAFEALFQQRPTAKEGAFFRVGELLYEDRPPPMVQRVRAWDVAATADAGDYTAGVLMGRDAAGRFWVLDVCRGRWSTDQRNREMRAVAERDGRDVRIIVPQDPGSAGVDSAQAFVRLLAGFPVIAQRVTGDKQTRADPLSSQVNAGNVTLVRGAWNYPLVEELRVFPVGKHYDQVDAIADAFGALAVGGGPVAQHTQRTHAGRLSW